jgi:hypothetical protein
MTQVNGSPRYTLRWRELITSILDKLGRDERMQIEVKGRLLGLVAIDSKASVQMHQEVDGTAVAGGRDLTDILELIDDGLDEGAFAQEQLVGEGHEDVVHVIAQFGDQQEALLEEETLGEGLRDVAFVAKDLAKEPMDQAWNGLSVVEIAGSAAEREQFPTIIDDKMELEAVEPAHRGLAATRVQAKDAVLLDASWMADGQGGRVDEADPRARPSLEVQIDCQGRQVTGHEVDEARVAHHLRELVAQVDQDVLAVDPLERAIARLLKRG